MIRRTFLFLLLSIGLFQPHANGQDNWRSQVGVFRLGIISGQDQQRELVRLEPFRVAIEKALDMEAEFFQAASPPQLLKALVTGRIEYAVMPPVLYALGHRACQCLEPVAIPKASDSTDGYHLVLLGKPGLMGIEDLPENPRIGSFNADGITSTSFATHLLERAGLEKVEETNLVNYSPSPSKAMNALQEGNIDALLGWSSLVGEPASGYSRGTLRAFALAGLPSPPVLWRSGNIPHLVHVSRKDLAAEAKNVLRNFLINLGERDVRALDAISPVYQGGLVAVRGDRFDIFASYVETLIPTINDDTSNGTTPPLNDGVVD